MVDTGLDKHKFSAYIVNKVSYVLGAQKNRLIETVLLSTHNICFGWEIRKLFFFYALLTKVLVDILKFRTLVACKNSTGPDKAYLLT